MGFKGFVGVILFFFLNSNSLTTVYLNSGEEFSGIINSFNESKISIKIENEEKSFPISKIVAIKENDTLTNGPFSYESIVKKYTIRLRSKDREATNTSASNEELNQSDTSKYILEFFKSSTNTNNSIDNNTEKWDNKSEGSASTILMTSSFLKCYQQREGENCQIQQIGFLGEDFIKEVRDVPVAKLVAEKIRITSVVKVISLLSIPVLGYYTYVASNESQNHSSYSLSVTTLSLLCLTAFGNLIGWNLYQNHLMKKAMEIHNNHIEIGLKLSKQSTSLVALKEF